MKAGVLAVAAGVVLVSSSAFAQGVRHTETPRTGAFQLKLGLYNPGPHIDAAAQGSPYSDTFDGAMWLVEAQYDRYLWQGLGAVGIGLSFGYAEKYGAATVEGDPDAETSVKTSLHVYPLKLMGLYSFDYLSLEFGIPLVPYVRAGLAYVPWRSTVGGEVEVVDGNTMFGGKWGLAGTAGLSFLMDVLEPRLAADFDSSVGVNNTYLFAEYNVLWANNFGGAGLDLSSSHLMFGLAFEF